MSTRVLLATRSQGKLRELNQIFAEFSIDAIDLETAGIEESPDEDSLEAFETFEDNALAKARHFFELAHIPTFGDDSGLVVDILGGEPGVYSKRWSGRSDLDGQARDDANNAKLVARLSRERATNPSFVDSARYVCVAAFKDADTEVSRRGEIEGKILFEPRGTGGFGYDPYFDAPDLGGTFAESDLTNTARKSHRSRAFRALLTALRAQGRI